MKSKRKIVLKPYKKNYKYFNKKKKKEKKFTPFFWLSFLLHCLAIFLLLIFAFKKINIFNLIDIQSKKKDIPASLKPRKSEFGTTVFFDPTPQFKPQQTEMLAQEKLQTQKEEEQTKQFEKQSTVAKEIKKTITDKTEEKMLDKKQTELAENKFGKKKIEKSPVTTMEKREDEIKKKIEEIQKKQSAVAKAMADTAIAQVQQQQQKAEQLKTLGKKEKTKSPITKPKRSIIAMTKGYVENLKDKGNDWLERKGDDNKKLSFEELKYISYEEKINWHLQSSWKRLMAHNPTQQIMQGKAIVEFNVDENGNVSNLNLLQSSGNNQLDKIILKSVEFATPFPPLPKHFNTKIYSTGRIIYVNSQRLKF